jgi:hypothetical protein
MPPTEQAPLVVNGRAYPLWSQFVQRQDEWIGGRLQDMDKDPIANPTGRVAETKITGIKLTPNGTDSAWFAVNGEDFSCGFDVTCGGVIGGEDGWLTLSGYRGHVWRIKKPEPKGAN